jgi:hypothetical protein
MRAPEHDPQRRFSSAEQFRAARQRIGNQPRQERRRFTW